MKKLRLLVPILLSLLAALLCIGLASCTGSNPPAQTEGTTPDTGSDETVTEQTTDAKETTAETEAETEAPFVPEPINRSEYPKEQAGAKTDVVLKASDYGVVGDGVTDDGPAIDRAVNAAVEQQATLVFDGGKTYYIASTDNKASGFASPFAMEKASGVTIDGGGSIFKMAPGVNYFAIVSSSDIKICNMKLNMSVTPYLVGTVKAVNGITVTFDTDIAPNASYHNYQGSGFSIKYNEGIQNRPHMFINEMKQTGEREVVVQYTANTHPHSVGDKVFLPNPGIGHVFKECIYVGHNTGCLVFENIELWAASSFVAAVKDNDAEIYFDNVDYVPGEENDREIKMVSWRDGYHCKDNRRPIHWNECDVGVLFDDVFNVSNTLGYVTSVKNGGMFTITNYEFYQRGMYVSVGYREGDIIDVFSNKGAYAGEATVRRVVQNPNGTVDLVLEYGENLSKVEAGWLVGNRDTCAPGSTVTDCRFEGTFRFRRDIRIERCTFDMLITWIREDGSVEGPLPGNIDYVDCTFNEGSIDIGAAGNGVRNAIVDIGFWNCDFNRGAKITAGRGCEITEKDSWTEEELFTVKNRKMTADVALITPNEQDFKNTVTYDWTKYTMNLEGGKILPLSKLENTAMRDILANSDYFGDKVLVLTGAEGATRFELGGLSAEYLPTFHQNEKSYIITIYYYTTDAVPAGGAGFLTGETATSLSETLFTEKDGIGSSSVMYNAKDGNTGIYLDVPAGMTVYVGKINITAASGKNPSIDQLENGHTFVWSEDLTIGENGTVLTYDQISDTAVRDAIKGAESGFTAGSVLHVKGDLGVFSGFTDKEYYVQGKTYHLSIDAYIASPMVPKDGTKIYLMALDDTEGNRLLAEGLFTGEGFYHFEVDWTVGATGERCLTFFINNVPTEYADLYIGDFTITVAKSLKPDTFLSRDDFHTLTAEELKAGYTFDFSEGNLMETGVHTYASTSFLPENVSKLLRANGFGDTFYYCNENFILESLPNELTGGKRFRITLQVYDVLGNLATSGDRGVFLILHMQGGVQNSAEVSYKATVSEEDSRLITLTFEHYTPGGTDDLLFYSLSAMEFLVGSVTIQQLN